MRRAAWLSVVAILAIAGATAVIRVLGTGALTSSMTGIPADARPPRASGPTGAAAADPLEDPMAALTTPTGPPLSPADLRACRAFAPMADASHRGVLRYDDFRDGLRTVHDLAQADPDSQVAAVAAALLQQVTMGSREDTPELRRRLLALIAVCKDWDRRPAK